MSARIFILLVLALKLLNIVIRINRVKKPVIKYLFVISGLNMCLKNGTFKNRINKSYE